MHTPDIPTILYYNRNSKWLAFALGLFSAGLGAVIVRQSLLIEVIFGWLLLLLGSAMMGWALLRLRKRKPALVASREGLWLAPYRALGVIPWSEILALRTAPDDVDFFEAKHQPSSSLLVELAQPSVWIARMPNSLSQGVMRLNQTHFHAAIIFNCWDLQHGSRCAKDIVALLQRYKGHIVLDDTTTWPNHYSDEAPKLA